MKFKNKIRLLVIATGVLFASSSFAKSPVFKITKGEDQLYIGGSIHLLSPNDYPLPAGFQQAFNAAEHVYFETDISQLSSPEVQTKFTSRMTSADGKTLKSVLSKKTYSRLEDFLAERNVPIAAFEQFTPAAASVSLSAFELQRLGLGNPASGVDQYFDLKTRDANKTPLYLESIDEQIGFLDAINAADPNLVIGSTLDGLIDLESTWKEALTAWRAGDIESAGDSLGADSMRSNFPDMYKLLLTDRNNRWLIKIEEMFNSKEIEFVLVGALHLANDDGLIKSLDDAGYTIEQLD